MRRGTRLDDRCTSQAHRVAVRVHIGRGSFGDEGSSSGVYTTAGLAARGTCLRAAKCEHSSCEGAWCVCVVFRWAPIGFAPVRDACVDMPTSRLPMVLGFTLATFVIILLLVSANISSLTASMFGPPSMASTSTAPYEIVLRSFFKGGKRFSPASPPLEWRLTLPRAFVYVEIGRNGDAYAASFNQPKRWYNFGINTNDEFFIHLHGVLEKSSDEIRPAIFAPKELLARDFIGMDLTNSSTFPQMLVADYCVRDDDYENIRDTYDLPLGRKPCSDASLRCQINTSLDGWDIRLTVARSIYAQPQKACAAARKFLSSHTVRRDDVR